MSEKADKKEEKKTEVGEFVSDPDPIDLSEDIWKEFWLLNVVDHYR